MEYDNCKHEEKILEMSVTIARIDTNIGWMIKDAERRNGIVEDHLITSVPVRDTVNRNVTWRHAYKALFTAIFVILGFMVKFLISMHVN